MVKHTNLDIKTLCILMLLGVGVKQQFKNDTENWYS